MEKKIRPFVYILAILMVICLIGCSSQTGTSNSGDIQNEPPATEPPEENLVPIEEIYEYTATGRVYSRPAMLTNEQREEFLSLTTDDGFFFCATADTKKADDFINAQRTLLQFLRDSGMETPKLNYFAMDFDDSFSESEKKRAHIALSASKSYQQVLITLQTLWGDYTDYGYLYAISNAIAAHLGWQTDATETVEQSTIALFFVENPEALNLLYPCFTTTYASEETVRSCKALCKLLIEERDLREVLANPIDEQVNDFRALVDTYAQEISVTFSRQKSGYAYYGEHIPLKIMTTYVQHFIDRDYKDYAQSDLEELGDNTWDYFSDYQSIFATVDIMNEEIARSVEYFGLEEAVGVVTMNWICTESSFKRFDKPNQSCYVPSYDDPMFGGTIYLTEIFDYLHEYFHHFEFITRREISQTWQSQAFADLGKARSQHAHHIMWRQFSEEPFRSTFLDCYGREYQSELDHYYDAYDLLSYLEGNYEFDYHTGGADWNSLTHYLLDLYGEDTVVRILLLPEIVETITGKTWDELQIAWQKYMERKFEHFEIPDWVYGSQE